MNITETSRKDEVNYCLRVGRLARRSNQRPPGQTENTLSIAQHHHDNSSHRILKTECQYPCPQNSTKKKKLPMRKRGPFIQTV